MGFVIWLIIAMVLIIFEIITVSLTAIWFAGGAFIAAILSFAGAGLAAQLVVFIIVSLVLFVFTRPVAAKYIFTKKEKTNIDAIIGKQAVVKETVDNVKCTGVVKLGSLEWSARSVAEPIEEGRTVIVKAIDGVKLIVEAMPK